MKVDSMSYQQLFGLQEELITSQIASIEEKEKQKENQNNGRSNTIEIEKYQEFLENERVTGFRSKQVFSRMSIYLQTRSNQQCRSHHQKFNPYKGKISFKKRSYKSSLQNKKEMKDVGVQTQISIDQELKSNNLTNYNTEIEFSENRSVLGGSPSAWSIYDQLL